MHLIKLIDATVSLGLVHILGVFAKKEVTTPTLKKNSRVLLIKKGLIGDSVYTLPLLKSLYDEKKVHIDVMCDGSNRIVYRNQNFVKNTFDFSIKNMLKNIKKYDVVIDAEPWANSSAVASSVMGVTQVGFSDQTRSKLYTHTVKYNRSQHVLDTYLDIARLLQCTPKRQLQKISIKEKPNKEVEKLLKNKIIGIAPGVAGKVRWREWPASNWNKLIKQINKEMPKYTVVLIGVKEDKELGNVICKKTKSVNFHGKTNLKQAVKFIEHMSVLIGVDSGPIHIAAAQNTPVVALFGPNTPVIWGPPIKKAKSIWHKQPGLPSIDNTKPGYKKETQADRDAMKAISVDEVFTAMKEVMKK